MRITRRRWRQGSAEKRPLPQTGNQMSLSSATIRDPLVWKSRPSPWKHAAAPSGWIRASGLIGVAALALLGMARPVAAAIAYVQDADQDPASASSVSVKYATAQTAGDLNVVAVAWNNSTSAVNSVTDTSGNAYLLAVGPTSYAGKGTQLIYYAQNIAAAAAGANTVTVTFNATVPYPDVRILEYSGISSSALDVAVGASGNSSSLSSGAVTTTNANDLLVGANYIGGCFKAVGTGYTQRLVTSPDCDLVEDEVVAATGSYSATATQGGANWWVMQLAAFRKASGTASFAITPRNADLTLLQTQQFTNNAPSGTTLNWSVDGVAGGNSTVGTISSSGLYTPPSSAGTHTVTATSSTNSAYTASSAVAVTDLTGITTHHYDVARTGQNLQEYALTPSYGLERQFRQALVMLARRYGLRAAVVRGEPLDRRWHAQRAVRGHHARLDLRL